MKTITISDDTWDTIKDQVKEGELEDKKKSKIEIKTISGSILWESEKETIKEAVVEAVEKGANLRGANLRDANLEDANLEDADLVGANLGGAYLKNADFYHTKFYGKDGTTKIKKNQVDDFFKALGIVVEN